MNPLSKILVIIDTGLVGLLILHLTKEKTCPSFHAVRQHFGLPTLDFL